MPATSEQDNYARHKARQDAINDIRQILNGLDAAVGAGAHVFVLSDYEVANLRAALDAAVTSVRGPNPLAALNNGDWLNQLRLRIPETEYHPIKGPMQLIDEAVKRVWV